MRVAIVGAAAAAVLGGALAVAPLTISNQSRTSTGGTCSAGQQCDKLASVLMPETGKPGAMAPKGAPSALEPQEPAPPAAVTPKEWPSLSQTFLSPQAGPMIGLPSGV